MEPQISLEVDGHMRYLIVKQGELSARERIPLHIFNLPDGDEKTWFMKDLITKLKRKMFKKIRVR